MMKRIAGLVAIAVIASQALMGSAFALTSVTHNGLGDPYSGRLPQEDCDLERGIASGSESVTLQLEGNQLVCWNSSESDTVLLSAVRQPLEVIAGGGLKIYLNNDDTDYPADFKGLAMEIQVGGFVYFDANHITPDVGSRGSRLTVTNTSIQGHGLQNAEIQNAASIVFEGSDYDDYFDGSAVTVGFVPFGNHGDSGIYGDDGNDVLKGGSGDDVIDGEDDDDTVFGNAGDDVIFGGDENDKVFGGEGDDWIDCEGDDYTEECWGNAGDDTIHIDGDDSTVLMTVAPGDGADELQFYDDKGSVTLYYGDTSKGQAVTITDDCRSSDLGEDYAPPGFDDCDAVTAIVGSAKDDVFDVSDSSRAYVVLGGAGNDAIYGDDYAYFVGGAGNDVLAGGDSVIFSGGEGDDTLKASGTMKGGAGDDLIRVTVGSSTNWLYGGPGNDRIDGDKGWSNEYVWAGKGNDLVYGYGWYDSISLGQGNDRASAGDGADDVSGGPGNDQIHGDGDDDELYGGAGTDHVWGDTDDWNTDYSYSLDDGDMCEGEVVAECEWVSSVGPAGPYWVRLA